MVLFLVLVDHQRLGRFAGAMFVRIGLVRFFRCLGRIIFCHQRRVGICFWRDCGRNYWPFDDYSDGASYEQYLHELNLG